MTLVIADRVKQQTLSSGVGDMVVSGTLPGFQTLAQAMHTNDTTYYCILDNTNLTWETGVGTLKSSTTFGRTTFGASSSGSPINFAGNNNTFIFISITGQLVGSLIAGGAIATLSSPGLMKPDGVTTHTASDGTTSVIGGAFPDLNVAQQVNITDQVAINNGGDERTTLGSLNTLFLANDGSVDETTLPLLTSSQVPNMIFRGIVGTSLAEAGFAAVVAAVQAAMGSPGTTPTYSSALTVSAPTTMTVGTAANVTLTGGSGGLDPAKNFTPVAPVNGTFSPASHAGNGTTPLVFAFTPGAAGSGTFGSTNTGTADTVTLSASVTIAAAGSYPSMVDTVAGTYSSTAKFGSGSRSGGTGAVSVTMPTNGNSGNVADVSYGFWFKGGASTASPSGGFLILHRPGGEYWGWLFTGGNLSAYAASAGAKPSGVNVRDGNWHYLFVTLDGNQGFTYTNFYVDGTLVYNGNTQDSLPAGPATISLDFTMLQTGDLVDDLVVYGSVSSSTVPTAAISRTSSTVPLALLPFDGSGTGL